jgi:hypothetical protein
MEEDPRCTGQAMTGLPEEVVMGLNPGTSFQRLDTGTIIPMEMGPQGGQHITIAVQLFPTSGDKWTHSFTLTSPTGEELGSSAFNAKACTNLWNEWDRVRVFINETTTEGGQLTLTSSPIGESRQLTSSVSIRIDPIE